MSETSSPQVLVDGREDVHFDVDQMDRIQRALEAGDYAGLEEFVQDATLRLVGDLLDEDGRIECPHDDCDRTFATIRERRGHLGSSAHALDVPEGDFWCGYCGYGPTSWRGVNAHHGSSDHGGDPVRLEDEPEETDLLAPDDVPDHQNPDLLERLYYEHDGNYSAMCRAHDFDVTPGRVRHYLIEFGIHQPTSQGPSEDGDGPVYRNPEWLQDRYDDADGNVSEMHRNLDVDVPYRTLLKNLKNLGIHDPTESPGRSQSQDHGDEVQTDSEPDVDETDDVSEAETEPEGEAEPEFSGTPDSEVESFHDLETPDWLDEGSFYAAVDMAGDVDELGEVLGWDAHDRLERMVNLLDADLDGPAGDDDE